MVLAVSEVLAGGGVGGVGGIGGVGRPGGVGGVGGRLVDRAALEVSAAWADRAALEVSAASVVIGPQLCLLKADSATGHTIRNTGAVLLIRTERRQIVLAVLHAEIRLPSAKPAPGSRLAGKWKSSQQAPRG